jgi:hypothetical protein
MDQKKNNKDRHQLAHEKAEEIGKRLGEELQIAIEICKENDEKKWSKLFTSRLKALSSLGRSSLERLADALINLGVFGSMGSWSDIGVDAAQCNSFHKVYLEGRDFCAKCWKEGIKAKL